MTCSATKKIEGLGFPGIDPFVHFFCELQVLFADIFIASSISYFEVSPPLITVTPCINYWGIFFEFAIFAVSRNASHGSAVGHIFQADSVVGMNPAVVFGDRCNINLISPMFAITIPISLSAVCHPSFGSHRSCQDGEKGQCRGGQQRSSHARHFVATQR